jgi:hypothetical protein
MAGNRVPELLRVEIFTLQLENETPIKPAKLATVWHRKMFLLREAPNCN